MTDTYLAVSRRSDGIPLVTVPTTDNETLMPSRPGDPTMSSLDDVATGVGRVATAVRTAVRTLGPVDTNPVPADWDHVTKVDPEDAKLLPLVYPLYLQHTDGISVGGSTDVTPENTEDTFELLAYVPTPAFHEPSAPEHVTDASRERAAFLAIPEVINGDTESLIGKLGKGIEQVTSELAPSLIDRRAGWVPNRLRGPLVEFAGSWLLADAIFEAYIIQNVDSAAAREANVTDADRLGPDEARRRAMAAERRLGSEVIYLEYSGRFGGAEAEPLLRSIADGTNWSRVWYGGGIGSRTAAHRMLRAGADTVVVGDAFHDVAEEEAALAEQARVELGPGADREVVAAWVEETIDAADSKAARFLSTIPTVSRPVVTAGQYLGAGVTIWLAIEELANKASDARSPAGIRAAIRNGGVPELAELNEMGEYGRLYAGNFTLAAVGARRGIAAGTLPVDHLSLTVPTGIDVE